MYDFLIVGAGLFGCIFAREATNAGYKCLVIDKRNHIGGNCYSEFINNIHVTKYSGHILHTNNEMVWHYVNKYANFRQYHHVIRVNYKNKIYPFPINLDTLGQLWKIKTPEEAEKKLKEVQIAYKNPSNLEEWFLSQVGKEIYEIFIKGYTKKQWQEDPKNLPIFIGQRVPIKLIYECGYYQDKYQGWPEDGYTEMFNSLLSGIEYDLEQDYFKNREKFNKICKRIIYTGAIDQYYNYYFGQLEYITLKFKNKFLSGDQLGCATMNYTDENIPYTRIIEHKHFQPHKTNNKTIITYEYPNKWHNDNDIRFYPVNNTKNNTVFHKYSTLNHENNNVIFGGRLAKYKYYDMDDTILSALNTFKKATI